MKVTVSTSKIRCDVPGCKGISTVFIKKDEKSYSFDSVKLCTECAKGISVALRKFYQKSENKNEKKDS